MRTIVKQINIVVLFVVTLTAAAVSVGDLFGLLPDNWRGVPAVTLVLIAGIGLHIGISHMSSEDFQTTALGLLRKIEREARVPEIRVFEDSVEIENYLGKRLLEAQKSVCDLSWKKNISAGFSASGRQLSHTYMDKCIASTSDRIPYREIFVFSDPRRVEKLRRRLREKKKGYSCRYYRNDSEIPRLQFVIIDDTEVIFFASANDSPLCSVRNTEVAKVFRSYFDAAWAVAVPIKQGPVIHQQEVDSILSSPPAVS
ncbi:hypothetical protein CUT44_18245 [Streptomyces carminius]|uniref:Uncharacterized protein n=1 Tax=Streptomyces carminius TaxID=2665496 RepID=A0A2M8LWV9_9ACTN|nr:hypothetical protein [Streptomyces carminius]PJE96443.1 hypothetical protein CUT44_18245 [Streptomyces carminius]